MTAAFLDAHGDRVLAELCEHLTLCESEALLPVHRTLYDLLRAHVLRPSPRRTVTGLRRALTGTDPGQYAESLLPGQITLWSLLHRALRHAEGPQGNTRVLHSVLALVGDTLDGFLGALIDVARSGGASGGGIASRWDTLVELGRTHREMQMVNRISCDLLSARDPERMLQILEEGILSTFHLRSLSISVVDRRNGTLDMVRAYPPPPDASESVRWSCPLDHPDILCDVARSGRMEVIDGWDPRYYERIVQEDGSAVFRQVPRGGYADQTAIFMPILSGGDVIGVVATGSTQESKRIALREIGRMSPFLNQVGGSLLAVSELADRKRAGEELRRAHAKLSATLDALPDIFFEVDREGRIYDYRAPRQELLYASPGAFLGKRVNEVLPEKPAGIILDALEMAVQHGHHQGGVYSLDLPSGVSWFELSIATKTEGGDPPERLVVLVRDITARKQAEEALRESEERFRRTFDQSPIGAAIVAANYRFIRCNEALCRILGYSEEELRSLRFIDITHPDHLEVDRTQVRRLQAGEIDHYTTDKRYIRKDGQIVWVHLSLRAIRDGAGGLLYFLPMLEDITEWKQAEIEYSALLQIALDGFWVVDMDGRILEVNEAACRQTGYSRDELLKMRISDIDASETPEEIARRIQALRRDGMDRFEVRHRSKDGRIIDVEVSSNFLPIGGGRFFAFLRDITERKKMEQELIRYERLRAMEEISAGVSHNLNNMLTGVLGHAELLRRELRDANLLSNVDGILASGMRVRDLVHRLHLSTRGLDESSLQPVKVNQEIEDAIRITSPRWKDASEARGITITVTAILGDVPPIRGTGPRFHDIVVNLVLNAVDAMPNGGAITIRTEAMEEGVQITVRDTGIGMKEETRRRVFEPFFTTKYDVGSGLGLSTTYKAITQWGGRINVESEPGKGAVFTIRLPVWTGPGDREEVRAGPRRGRRGRLLIVEDDETVASLLTLLLSPRHEVEVIGDGRKALERHTPGAYDVAMIDMGLPGMSGDRVMHEMKKADPSLATVLITGWELDEDDPRRSGFDFHLQKPIPLGEVESTVAQAIELHDARTR